MSVILFSPKYQNERYKVRSDLKCEITTEIFWSSCAYGLDARLSAKKFAELRGYSRPVPYTGITRVLVSSVSVNFSGSTG